MHEREGRGFIPKGAIMKNRLSRKRFLFVTSIFFVSAANIFSQMPGQQNIFAYNLPPSRYALETFRELKRILDIPKDEIGIAANPYVPNAMATVMPVQAGFDQWGRPVYRPLKTILYNPNFMAQMEITTGSKWAGISILAHEIGHHKGNHIISDNPWDSFRHPWEKELEADYYSGKALARMGAQPKELQNAQRQMFSFWGSPTHPDTLRRIQKINEGWRDGGGRGDVETDLMSLWRSFQEQLSKWYE